MSPVRGSAILLPVHYWTRGYPVSISAPSSTTTDLITPILVFIRFSQWVMQKPSLPYLSGSPDKKTLNDVFVGRPIASLRTPALVVDRAIFAANCARMHQNVASWGADFRAHIKTHKVRPLVIEIWIVFLAFTPRRRLRAPNSSWFQKRDARALLSSQL